MAPYSCETAAETREWIAAIVDFISPYSFLLDAHVVNFFKDRLWEAVDEEWINCLRLEPVENLLGIPSGVVQDHWPASLKEFVRTLRTLVFPREQAELQKIYPDLLLCSLDSVLSQGMNLKKRHEVEVLAAVSSSVAMDVGSHTIVDVGAGQGYLAQVLSFQYRFSVVAIDASTHHGKITGARAQRIKKHYATKIQKSSYRAGDRTCGWDGPKVVTCRVLSSDSLKTLSDSSVLHADVEAGMRTGQCLAEPSHEVNDSRILPLSNAASRPLLLAGLHACGDLSVTMLSLSGGLLLSPPLSSGIGPVSKGSEIGHHRICQAGLAAIPIGRGLLPLLLLPWYVLEQGLAEEWRRVTLSETASNGPLTEAVTTAIGDWDPAPWEVTVAAAASSLMETFLQQQYPIGRSSKEYICIKL